VAYTTGPHSLILVGDVDTEIPSIPTEIIFLQDCSLQSVVVGNRHFGSLTSSGSLLTWGSYWKGALGLGFPFEVPARPNSDGALWTFTSAWNAPLPPDVLVPAGVDFHRSRRGGKRFCVSVAAGGSQMGALVIDLEV